MASIADGILTRRNIEMSSYGGLRHEGDGGVIAGEHWYWRSVLSITLLPSGRIGGVTSTHGLRRRIYWRLPIVYENNIIQHRPMTRDISAIFHCFTIILLSVNTYELRDVSYEY